MYQNKLSQKFSTSIWFKETIADFKNDHTFSQMDIQTTITESILEYFNENLTFDQLLELITLIKTTNPTVLTPFLDKLLSQLVLLAQYAESEEEDSEQIYLVLTDILKKLIAK